MVEQDTVKLLRECDAGVKMGISSIEEVLDNVADKEFEKILTDCKNEHNKLDSEIRSLLGKYNDEGKEQNRKKRKTQGPSPLEGTDNLLSAVCAEFQRFHTHDAYSR